MSCHHVDCSLGVDCEAVKGEALKRLKGDQEAEQPKKKRVVGMLHPRQQLDLL
jgi:hypothetical protein